MNSLRYLRWFVAIVVIGWLLLDPPLYLVDQWDLETLPTYLVERPQYLYVGDSVTYSQGHCEVNPRTVVDYLNDATGRRYFPFVHAGLTPAVLSHAAPWLSRYNPNLRTVVIELNLRVFDPRSIDETDVLFARQNMVLDLVGLRLDLRRYLKFRYTDYELVANAGWLKRPLYDDQIALGTVPQIEAQLRNIQTVPCGSLYGGQEDLLGLRFAYQYGFVLTHDNALFGFIRRSVEPLRAAGVNVLLYLTPINVEAIAELKGDPLHARVMANLEMIRRVAEEHGWALLDLSAAMPNEHFVDRFCACEHVDTYGRRFIAQAVGAELARRFPAKPKAEASARR